MDLSTVLTCIGLTDKEAKIYLTLLELNDAIPSVIARRAKVKRPTTYIVLEKLKSKGLVSYVKKKNLLYFRALNPHYLLEEEYFRYRNLEKALPELLKLRNRYISAPQMSVFEGKEGIIRIMEDTLTAKTELLCWGDMSEAVECLKDYYPLYIKKKVGKGLWLRGVFSESKTAHEFQDSGKKELREVYIIPKDKFPFKNEINIYDDKVGIISHKDEMGVIIQNSNIADTQRSIFELGFEYAKLLNR